MPTPPENIHTDNALQGGDEDHAENPMAANDRRQHAKRQCSHGGGLTSVDLDRVGERAFRLLFFRIEREKELPERALPNFMKREWKPNSRAGRKEGKF
jgi:hypothetical protein